MGSRLDVSSTASAVPLARAADSRPRSRPGSPGARRPWRPQEPTNWTFLFDIGLTFALVLLGAWLFIKMRGG